MKRSNLTNLADECLQQMLAGSSLDEVLAQHPDQAAQLRPLLETAWMARSLNTAQVPTSAQNRSRTAFLTAAGQAQSAPQKRWLGWMPALRFSSVLTIVVIALLATVLLGGGLVSAESLPGDTLYPVKIAVERARLSLTTDPSTRIALEESYDQERLEESRELRQLGRSQTVSFAGFLERDSDDGWKVGELDLTLPSELSAKAASLDGFYVEVQGKVHEDDMLVESLDVRTFELTGPVDRIDANEWRIAGVKVHLLAQTEIRLSAKPGDSVRVLAVRMENGDLVALVITSIQDTASGNFPLPAGNLLNSATALPVQPLETETPEPEHLKTDEPSDDKPEHMETSESDDSSDSSSDDAQDNSSDDSSSDDSSNDSQDDSSSDQSDQPDDSSDDDGDHNSSDDSKKSDDDRSGK